MSYKEDFINQIAPYAQRYNKNTFASTTIAQACLESGYGQSDLAKKYNNFFGIKGGGVSLNTLEDDGAGNYYQVIDDFRVYKDMEASVKDHDELFTSTPGLTQIYSGVVAAQTPEDQCRALQGTYATDTKYASKLLNILNTYDLKRFDIEKGVRSMPEPMLVEHVIDYAQSLLGTTKYSQTHKNIVDMYNQVSPKPVGHTATYHDDWCDVFVTHLFDVTQGSHLIGRECGVQRHLVILKQKGIWLGRVKPQPGDIIIYDWQGYGAGWADHIGIVESYDGVNVHTIEGNTGNPPAVRRVTYPYNASYIVGYARPQYDTKDSVKKPNKGHYAVKADSDGRETGFAVGDKVKLRVDIKAKNPAFVEPAHAMTADDFEKEWTVDVLNTDGSVSIKSGDSTHNVWARDIVNLDDYVSEYDVAQQVLDGEWGNNPERAEKLHKAGYNAVSVQEKVNELVESQDDEEVIEPVEEQPVGGDRPELAPNEVCLDGVVYVINKKEE